MTDVFAQKLVQRYLRYTPADCDILVEERYDLNDLGFKGYIIHTPGHSPGSISVILENEIAIVGDTLFGVSENQYFRLMPMTQN
jgi:hydroxyacylglutathione hydrolase